MFQDNFILNRVCEADDLGDRYALVDVVNTETVAVPWTGLPQHACKVVAEGSRDAMFAARRLLNQPSPSSEPVPQSITIRETGHITAIDSQPHYGVHGRQFFASIRTNSGTHRVQLTHREYRDLLAAFIERKCGTGPQKAKLTIEIAP